MTNKDVADKTGSRNLSRLFVLRNLMIGAYLLGLVSSLEVLDIELPVMPTLGVIGLLILVNSWTWWRVRVGKTIGDWEFFGQLSIDMLGLAAVLYLTGGATNPFAWLFLLPLMIAATVLPAYMVWAMTILAIACYSVLMFYFIPFGTGHAHQNQYFIQHVFGMWFGFIMSALLVAFFVVRMQNGLRRRDQLLARTREQCLRDEQLVALGTLATGAAHELGTPLATMAVLTGELEHTHLDDSTRRKLKILRDQILRCKKTLSVISASAGEIRAESGSLAAVTVFLDQIVREWQKQRLDARVCVQATPGPSSARILDEYTLHQALINLLNNAADASPDDVMLKATWDERFLTLGILDRGPGLYSNVAARIADPKTSNKEHGMGLGLLLTHATVKRMGGEIALRRREGGGTYTQIRLPLTDLNS
jgi:two-component system sensor histidine kinase RegB